MGIFKKKKERSIWNYSKANLRNLALQAKDPKNQPMNQ